MAESLRTNNSEDKTEPELVCDLCRMDDLEIIAVKYCVKCMDWLCNSCFKRHTNNAVFKTHNTVDKDELPLTVTPETLKTLKDAILCDTHEVQLEYMCNDHMELICKICLKKTHRNCNQISQLQGSVNPVLTELQCTRKRLLNITEQQKERIQTLSEEKEKQSKLRSSITADIIDVLKKFNETDTDGQSKYETEVRAAQLVLNQCEEIAFRQDKNEHLLKGVLFLNDDEKAMVVAKYVQLSLRETKPSSVNSESSIDVKSTSMGMSNRLEEVKHITNELVNINWSKESASTSSKPIRTYKDAEVQTEPSDETVLATAPELLGIDSTSTTEESDHQTDDAVNGIRQSQTISTEKENAESQNSPTEILETPLFNRTLEFIGSYDLHFPEGRECCISSIVVLCSGRIIIADSSNVCLKVYDGFFNLQFMYKLKWQPVDLCVLALENDNEQVAISFNPRRVETYAIHSDTVKYIRGMCLSLHCRGICVMSGDNVGILGSNVESMDKEGAFPDITSTKDNIEIQIRNIKHGRILHSIGVFSNEIHCPIYIIPDIKGNIVVGEENQVSAFNTKGERLWYYNGYKGRKLDGVLGMTIDPEGNVYICSSGSDTVHQVSSSNYKCNRIVIDNLPSPGFIAYDPCQERLIVSCDKHNTVYVYRFVNLTKVHDLP